MRAVNSEMPRIRDNLPAALTARIGRLQLRMSGKTARFSLWSRRFTAADRAKCESHGLGLDHNPDILDMWRVARGTSSTDESVIEIAHALGYISGARRARMLAALADDGPRRPSLKSHVDPKASADPEPRSAAVPHWDHESRELRYRGCVVRTVKRPSQANNIVTILRAFEKAGWPSRIEDPFKRKPSDETRRRDVYNLNKKLDRNHMFFACDGDGTGFLWKKVPRAKPKKAAKRRRRAKPA